jgi:hypothetical protein
MTMLARAHPFNRAQKASRMDIFKRMLHYLGAILSAPRGYQGGWEGGARGL